MTIGGRFQTGLDRRGWVVISSVFIAMTGYGITLPVLPVFVERLDLGPLAHARHVALHVGAMTAAYAAAQLATSALWGRLTDRFDARKILLAGLAGFAIGQLLFGLSTQLEALYAARLLAGASASALITASSAFIASEALPDVQARALAWKGMASSLGVVAGPVLGGILVRPGAGAHGVVVITAAGSDAQKSGLVSLGFLVSGVVVSSWLQARTSVRDGLFSCDGRPQYRSSRPLLHE